MTLRSTPAAARGRGPVRPVQGVAPADDDEFNDEMTRIMTAAADLRVERNRVRSGEDERLALHEAASIRELIQNRWPDGLPPTQAWRGNPGKATR